MVPKNEDYVSFTFYNCIRKLFKIVFHLVFLNIHKHLAYNFNVLNRFIHYHVFSLAKKL